MQGILGVVGLGNMGEALVSGVIRAGLVPPERIIASRPDAPVLWPLAAGLGIHGTLDNREVVAEADVLLLAVKPQILPAVLAEISPGVTVEKLVISIVAGVPTQVIEAQLEAPAPVVRVMPNTPALVSAGASALCLGSHATEAHAALTRTLLEAVGVVMEVEEHLMDAVTAVSGSGPAYVFYLLEAMQSAGEAVGLAPELSRALATQTLLGAAQLAASSDVGAAELRRRVTSPGGTTQAAIAVLDDRGVASAVQAAVAAARDRGRALGSG